MMGRIILAAFKQRQRRPGFYFAMVALLLLPIFFTPQSQSSFRVMLIEPKVFKQADNPSWLPIASAIIFGFFLVLFGFSYIQNARRVDQENGLEEWLFTTQFSRLRYVFSKFVVNILLLLCLLGSTIVGTLTMMVLRFPGQGINPWVVISAYLMLLPGIILVAGLAIFIETLFNSTNAWILPLSTLGLITLWGFQDAYPTAWWAQLTNVGGISYALTTISRSVQATVGQPTESIAFFSDYTGSPNKISLYIQPVAFPITTLGLIFGEVLLALGLVVISAYVIRRRRTITGRRVRSFKMGEKVPPFMDVTSKQFIPVSAHTSVLSIHFLKMELNRQLSAMSLAHLIVLGAVWLLLWGGSGSSLQDLLLPLVAMLFLPFLARLGFDYHDFTTWLRTTNHGYQFQKMMELGVSYLIGITLVLPVLVKIPASALQVVLFITAQVSFAEGLGTYFNNGRFITALMTILWLLYLNGMTALLDIGHFNFGLVLLYGILTIGGLLITFKKPVLRH